MKSSMRRRLFLFVLALFCVLVVAPITLAKGIVSGSVLSVDGEPLLGVEISIAPLTDHRMMNHTLETNKKGNFYAQVLNGPYTVKMTDAEYGIKSIDIKVIDANHKLVYTWDGELAFGEQLPSIDVQNGYRVTLIIVSLLKTDLRKAHSSLLIGQTGYLLQENRRDEALEVVDNLLETSPDDPLGLMLRAYIYVEEGKLEAAEADLIRSLAGQPDLFDAHYQLAEIYRLTDRKQEALDKFRNVCELGRDGEQRGRVYLNIGELEREMGRLPEAISAFKNAIDQNPSLKLSVAPEIARLLSETGKSAEAENWIEELGDDSAAEIDPTVLYNLAVARMNSNEIPEAIEGFRRVIAAQPDFSEAHRNLGLALLNLGQTEEALESLRRYLELDPEGTDADSMRALITALSG
jgi:tetratricopeptide (TPR) repeat protein